MSPGPVRVGATVLVPDHGHTKRGDGGLLDASIFTGKVPLVLGAIKRGGETAAITTANLIVGPAPGFWRVHVYVEITAKTANGTVAVTLGWTDAVGATTDATITLAVTSTGRFYGSVPMDIASGNMTYAVAIGTFTGTYSIRLVPERYV